MGDACKGLMWENGKYCKEFVKLSYRAVAQAAVDADANTFLVKTFFTLYAAAWRSGRVRGLGGACAGANGFRRGHLIWRRLAQVRIPSGLCIKDAFVVIRKSRSLGGLETEGGGFHDWSDLNNTFI